jgi:uncharacterized membrane protein YoaT (DUF817 family)
MIGVADARNPQVMTDFLWFGLKQAWAIIFGALLLAAILPYVNFFTHHYLWDICWVLVTAIFVAYRRTKLVFRPYRRDLWMPLLLGFVLVTFFIWIAENISTFERIWIYPNQQQGWDMVGISKLTAWFLLMQLSFVLIYVLRQFERSSAERNSTP